MTTPPAGNPPHKYRVTVNNPNAPDDIIAHIAEIYAVITNDMSPCYVGNADTEMQQTVGELGRWLGFDIPSCPHYVFFINGEQVSPQQWDDDHEPGDDGFPTYRIADRIKECALDIGHTSPHEPARPETTGEHPNG